MAKKVLRITSARPGFIRGGHAHPAEPTTYAADFFNHRQLAAIRAEPMLTVDEVDADDAASVIQRAASSSTITEQQFNEFVARMTVDNDAALDAAVKQAVAEALEKAEAEKAATVAELLQKAEAEKEAAVAEAFETVEAEKAAAIAELQQTAEAEKEAAVAEALKNAGAKGKDGEKETGGNSKLAAGKK